MVSSKLLLSLEVQYDLEHNDQNFNKIPNKIFIRIGRFKMYLIIYKKSSFKNLLKFQVNQ